MLYDIKKMYPKNKYYYRFLIRAEIEYLCLLNLMLLNCLFHLNPFECKAFREKEHMLILYIKTKTISGVSCIMLLINHFNAFLASNLITISRAF